MLVQLDRIDEYLSACQLGITMASIGIGFLGEPALAALIEPLFGGLSDGVATALAFAIAFALATSLHITVGEQVPKMMAITRAESTSRAAGALPRLFRTGHRAADLGADQASRTRSCGCSGSGRATSRRSTPRTT